MGRQIAGLTGLAGMLGVLLAPPPVAAADYVVEVRVQVARGCLLEGGSPSEGARTLGRIDLGSVARLDGPSSPNTGALLLTRPPRLLCNPDTAYQVSVNGGLHGGAGDLRFLARSDGRRGAVLPYRLFHDAAWQQPVTVGQVRMARVPSSGEVVLPLFARLDRMAEAPAPGLYTDVVSVTLIW